MRRARMKHGTTSAQLLERVDNSRWIARRGHRQPVGGRRKRRPQVSLLQHEEASARSVRRFAVRDPGQTMPDTRRDRDQTSVRASRERLDPSAGRHPARSSPPPGCLNRVFTIAKTLARTGINVTQPRNLAKRLNRTELGRPGTAVRIPDPESEIERVLACARPRRPGPSAAACSSPPAPSSRTPLTGPPAPSPSPGPLAPSPLHGGRLAIQWPPSSRTKRQPRTRPARVVQKIDARGGEPTPRIPASTAGQPEVSAYQPELLGYIS